MAKKDKKSKPAAKNTTDKKSKKAARKLEPRPVKTGKGASPFEVGRALVDMFNAGKFTEIEQMFWSPKVDSIEGYGVSLRWEGRKAVRAKNDQWMSTHQIHGATAEGPYVGATGFAVRFEMDVEDTTTGKRETMSEVGVYTIKGGKIICEEFMYRV